MGFYDWCYQELSSEQTIHWIKHQENFDSIRAQVAREMVLWASEGGFAVVHLWFCSRPPMVMGSSFKKVLLVIEKGGRPKGGSVVVCDNLPCNGTHCMSESNEIIRSVQFQNRYALHL